MKTGVICAMEKEMQLLSSGTDCSDIHLALSGIGKVNAAICAEKLIQSHHPDCIISTGVAGTFSDDIRQGGIVLASECAYHDVWCGEGCEPGQVQGLPQRFPADRLLLQIAAEAIPEAKSGLVCSGDQFYVSREEDERQRSLFPDALCVDMESAAIAQVCHIERIPFLAVRIISDTHNDGKQRESYSSFWKNLESGCFNAVTSFIKILSEIKYGSPI